MSSARQQDRNTVSSLERKLKTERDSRLLAESQLREERKRQKAEDAAAKQRDETTGHDACNALRIELEDDSRQLRVLLQEEGFPFFLSLSSHSPQKAPYSGYKSVSRRFP